MESAAMDMALDEIIATKNPRGGRGGRGRGRGSSERGRGSSDRGSGGAFRRNSGNAQRERRQNSSPYQASRQTTRGRSSQREESGVWKHDLYNDDDEEEEESFRPIGKKSTGAGLKVHISNLEFSVTEENLEELFDGVSKAVILYDRSGRSEGSGELTFARKSDAIDAVKKMNGIELNGQAIRLTLLAPTASANETLSPQVSRPKRVSSGDRGAPRSGGFVVSGGFGGNRRGSSSARGGSSRGRGMGRVRKPFIGGRGKQSSTAEELDAELEDYNNQS